MNSIFIEPSSVMAGAAVRRSLHINQTTDTTLVSVAVTVDTPAHRQIFYLPNDLHGFDGPVTLAAVDPRINMSSMVEHYVVWKLMNAHPSNRLAFALRIIAAGSRIEPDCLVKLLQLRGHPSISTTAWLLFCDSRQGQFRPCGRDEAMTVHAGSRVWDKRHSSPLGTSMAELTIDTEIAAVDPMRESNRLLRGKTPVSIWQVQVDSLEIDDGAQNQSCPYQNNYRSTKHMTSGSASSPVGLSRPANPTSIPVPANQLRLTPEVRVGDHQDVDKPGKGEQEHHQIGCDDVEFKYSRHWRDVR